MLCASAFEPVWEQAVAPWFAATAGICQRTALPAVVVVPTKPYADFLKARVLAAGQSTLGVHFMMHSDLWAYLQAALPTATRAATREDMHLLLAAAADEFSDLASAQSVACDPAPLRHAVDQILAAGWDLADLQLPALGGMFERFREYLTAAGLSLAPTVDHEIARAAEKSAPLFASLIVIGFDGSHWPLRTLLQAAVSTAEQATLCLFAPRLTADDLDQVWVNSWENDYGEARILDGPPQPFEPIADAMETGAEVGDKGTRLIVGDTLQDQARGIVAEVQHALADGGDGRIGVMFAERGALHRAVAADLDALEISCNDTIGFNRPEIDRAWSAWLDLQARATAGALLALVRAAPAVASGIPIPDDVTVQDAVERGLQRAYNEVMTDDLHVLAAARGWDLTRLAWLPESATFAQFVDGTLAALETLPDLGGSERLAFVTERAATVGKAWDRPIPRALYLRWLTDVTTRRHRDRTAGGKHPFARVQLVTYEDAEWQTWSHLVLAGLNRNSFPPQQVNPPYLTDAIVQELNDRAVTQGVQGEGHRVVRADLSLVIGSSATLAFCKRRFYNIIGSTTQRISFAATRRHPERAGLPWNPSDLLVRVCAATRGVALTDAHMLLLAGDTARQLEASQGPPTRAAAVAPTVDDTVRAYGARHDAAQPIGPYDFALDSPPAEAVTLWSTQWEAAVGCPELVWLSAYLGVADPQWTTDEIPWGKTVGTWVHRWMRDLLQADGEGLRPIEPVADLHARLTECLAATRGRAGSLFAAAGHAVPHWWDGLALQAEAKARRLATHIAALGEDGWGVFATEWRLPDNARVVRDEGCALVLSGRADLVLSRDDETFLIDYKTGVVKALTARGVAKGNGLQLLLYGLGLEAGGHSNIRLALVQPGDGPVKSIAVAELVHDDAVSALLDQLVTMQDAGIFGRLGNPRGEFGYSPVYPLATLPIDPGILREKWERTFCDE
jgi:hypothetical protein